MLKEARKGIKKMTPWTRLGVYFMKKIAYSCIWGPTMRAVLAKWGCLPIGPNWTNLKSLEQFLTQKWIKQKKQSCLHCNTSFLFIYMQWNSFELLSIIISFFCTLKMAPLEVSDFRPALLFPSFIVC